jgi:hypothetical protein
MSPRLAQSRRGEGVRMTTARIQPIHSLIRTSSFGNHRAAIRNPVPFSIRNQKSAISLSFPCVSCAPRFSRAPGVMPFQNVVLKLSREGEEGPHPRERKRMQTTPTTPEPAAAETTRRTTTCNCRRPSEGLLPNHRGAVVPAAETSIGQTMPGLPAAPRQPVTRYASLITLLHPASIQSKGYEIPGAPVALCYAILRFISVNNAQLRIPENALPFTQYDEIAGASFMLQSGATSNKPIRAKNKPSQTQTKPNKPPKKCAYKPCPLSNQSHHPCIRSSNSPFKHAQDQGQLVPDSKQATQFYTLLLSFTHFPHSLTNHSLTNHSFANHSFANHSFAKYSSSALSRNARQGICGNIKQTTDRPPQASTKITWQALPASLHRFVFFRLPCPVSRNSLSNFFVLPFFCRKPSLRQSCFVDFFLANGSRPRGLGAWFQQKRLSVPRNFLSVSFSS